MKKNICTYKQPCTPQTYTHTHIGRWHDMTCHCMTWHAIAWHDHDITYHYITYMYITSILENLLRDLPKSAKIIQPKNSTLAFLATFARSVRWLGDSIAPWHGRRCYRCFLEAVASSLSTESAGWKKTCDTNPQHQHHWIPLVMHKNGEEYVTVGPKNCGRMTHYKICYYYCWKRWAISSGWKWNHLNSFGTFPDPKPQLGETHGKFPSQVRDPWWNWTKWDFG